MTKETWLSAVRHHVSASAEVRPKGVASILSLYCDHCTKRMDALTMKSRGDPEQLAKRLNAIGWRLGRRLACPTHRNERKEHSMPNDTAPPVAYDIEQPALVLAATEKAKRAKRECISILEDVFNVEKGCYSTGESDETVGRTVNLAPAAVAKIREEFFGPIKRPPELAELFAAIEDATARMTEWQGNVNKEAASYDSELANLRGRVETVARRYG